ncbi:DNA-binding MarR family transcriptional regulator [Sphaerotilus hippei]|uniref:DNA-binding MarR family transcriptional regulator n=1 Tax=Sphaerotilus hippei TaxID=744406 RepID=A0A318GYH6_9BURK|nr:MarR family winged helix-turn-helix transcriptional regulator [Sphaerotilus hippei]PXW95172.1 DNA-binding MarR family transcriptional regulator [Sphaerotilus hippei]
MSEKRSSTARLTASAESDPIHVDSAVRVLRHFRVVFNAVKTHFQQVERQAGIGGAQLWALSVVQAQPGLGVNDLARAMDIHQTTASNLVRALVGSGRLVTSRNPTDRRAVHLVLTALGEQCLKEAPGPFAGVLPEALAGLDHDTLLRLDHDLQLLIRVLKADEQGAQTPLASM